MKSKWSRFNRLLSSGAVHLLYNSLSNSFVELDRELYLLLQPLEPGAEVALDDTEFHDLLISIKAIVESDEHEINKIIFLALSRRFNTSHICLTVNPTLACNFGCPYCFEHSHGGKPMTKEVEQKIVRYLKSKQNLSSIGVTWFGGEPLMAFGTVESLSKAIISLGKKYRAGLISNGYLVTKDIAKKLPDLCVDYIQITVDGLEKRHDSRRHLINGQPTFRRILNSIELLLTYAASTTVQIRVNVDHENRNDFMPLYEFLTSEFGNALRISPAFTNDSTDKGNRCVCNKYERRDFLSALLKKHGLDFSSSFPSGPRTECAVRSVSSLIIGPEGELYNCWNDVGDPDKVYGYIGEPNIEETAYLKYKMSADPLTNPECLGCVLFPVCNGGCPYERIKRSEKGLPANDCPLIKDDLDNYLWSHYLFRTKLKHQ